MSLIRKHGAVLQAWACLDLVFLDTLYFSVRKQHNIYDTRIYSVLFKYARILSIRFITVWSVLCECN